MVGIENDSKMIFNPTRFTLAILRVKIPCWVKLVPDAIQDSEPRGSLANQMTLNSAKIRDNFNRGVSSKSRTYDEAVVSELLSTFSTQSWQGPYPGTPNGHYSDQPDMSPRLLILQCKKLATNIFKSPAVLAKIRNSQS